MNYLQLYVHLVWATWGRNPWITDEIEARMYGAILKKCRDLKCKPLAIGGISDHVHLLVTLHPSVSVANLAGNVKGFSSHVINEVVLTESMFKWQGGYGAFTLRKDDIPQIYDYVHNQKRHHAESNLISDFERIDAE